MAFPFRIGVMTNKLKRKKAKLKAITVYSLKILKILSQGFLLSKLLLFVLYRCTELYEAIKMKKLPLNTLKNWVMVVFTKRW